MSETFSPPTPARPKGAAGAKSTETGGQETEKRGPGRPPKPDALAAMVAVARALKPFDAEQRREMLETILLMMS